MYAFVCKQYKQVVDSVDTGVETSYVRTQLATQESGIYSLKL